MTGDAAHQLAAAVRWWAGRLLIDGLTSRVDWTADPDGWAADVVGRLSDDDPAVQSSAAHTAARWATDLDSTPDVWWASPLGVCVAATGALPVGAVTQQQAADLLDVHRDTVRVWLDGGMLAVADVVGPTGGRMVDRWSASQLAVDRAGL